MRLQTYAMIIFGFCIVGWFLGMPSGFVTLWDESNGNLSPEFLIQRIGETMLNNLALAGVLGVLIAAAGLVAIYTGFSAMYVIPMLILLAIANLLIFPVNFFIDSSCTAIDSSAVCTPGLLGFPILLFLNIITILAFVEFIRGQV